MSAASASLNVVAGMVQTAAITGPAKLLTAAGEDLIGGVQKVLSETGEKREPLFDFSGLEYTVQPDAVVGPEIFLLLHRGAALEEKDLTVKKEGQLLLPNYKGLLLDDGAWLLLRLRRSTTYSGVRDWYETARAFRSKLSNLVSDVGSGVVTKEDALKKLKPSAGGDTLFDEYGKLRSIIPRPRAVRLPRISLSTIRVVLLWNVVKRFHRQEWTPRRGRETIYNPIFTRRHVRNAVAIRAQCVNRWLMSSLIVWASLPPDTTLSRVGVRPNMKDKPRGGGACSSGWKTFSLGAATRGASTQKLLLRV